MVRIKSVLTINFHTFTPRYVTVCHVTSRCMSHPRVPAKMRLLDLDTPRPVCSLMGSDAMHRVKSTWDGLPIIDLKSAIKLPVQCVPHGMHQPRETPADPDAMPSLQKRNVHKHTVIQPIAKRTRPHAPHRKSTPHRDAPAPKRPHKRKVVQQPTARAIPRERTRTHSPAQTRISNRTRRTVHVVTAGTEIQQEHS